MSRSFAVVGGMLLYLAAAGTLADAWSNPWDLCLWLTMFLGLLIMAPQDMTQGAALVVFGTFLAAPWLAGFWR